MDNIEIFKNPLDKAASLRLNFSPRKSLDFDISYML